MFIPVSRFKILFLILLFTVFSFWISVFADYGLGESRDSDGKSAGSAGVSGVKTSRNLRQCLDFLERKQSGWCELRVDADKPGIENVWPEKVSRIHQTVGPESVITASGAAAYDPGRMVLYFMGGGGSDYGGNEVYSFSLQTGEWRRLTNPSSLDHFTGSGRQYWIPDTRKVPASSHLYDGLLFNQTTQTLVLLTHVASDGARIRSDEKKPDPDMYLPDGSRPGQFEFNPSSTDVRNGLRPLTWRQIDQNPWLYPRTLWLPDGSLLLGSKKEIYRAKLEPTGKLSVGELFTKHGDYGPGYLVYDHHRKLVWFVHRAGLVAFDLNGTRVRRYSAPIPTSQALAFDYSGNAVIWDGADRVYWLDPDSKSPQWHVIFWGEAGPSEGYRKGIYGRWINIQDNIFAGISSHRQGIWIYKHSSASNPGRTISPVNIQKLVDKAPDNSEIKLPPGLYGGGLRISRPLTVDMAGGELMEVYGGKGVVTIQNAKGHVTVKNLKVNGKFSNAGTGNLSGVRISGKDFDVSLENVDIRDTAIGVMTDNHGGSLAIADSFIGDIGSVKRRGLSHIIYAGSIDSLAVSNTVLQRSMHLGHILKSRARKTRVINSKLLGLDSRHSRVIDLSCGGSLQVLNSVLQSSSNTDNDDLISVGVERPQNCKGGLIAGDVEISNSVIVFDRGAGGSGTEAKARTNRLFTWRTGVDSLKLVDSKIVNPGGTDMLDHWIERTYMASAAKNTPVYQTRAEANLSPIVNSEP